MKLLKNNTFLLILFLTIVLLTLFLNLFLGVYPILNLIKYMESNNYGWAIPLTVLFLVGLWLIKRNMQRKIINERIEIFNATMRTMQDILQNSASSMQLLVLDMKDEGMHEEIIRKAEKNIDELKAVIKTLAAIDPTTIELKELNRNLSVIKMNE